MKDSFIFLLRKKKVLREGVLTKENVLEKNIYNKIPK